MSGGFSVHPAELTGHAAEVSSVGHQVSECSTAANQEGVGGLVYGVLFDPTALPVLHEGKQHHAASITAAASLAQAIAAGLRSNAQTYTKIDGQAKTQLETIDPQVQEVGDGGRQ